MKRFTTLVLGIALAGAIAAAPGQLLALEAFPVITDPVGAGGVIFSNAAGGAPNIFADPPAFMVDEDGDEPGNNKFIVYSLNGLGSDNGAGFTIGISNGENGINESLDGADNTDVNMDEPNTEPVNAALAAVNAGGTNDGKLNNGNAFRFSAWFRLDPDDSANTNALFKAPQIEPVMKLEFWKEGLSELADTNPGQIQPLYGDKVFDQDQHGGPGGLDIDNKDQAQWVDVDNNGSVVDGDAAGDGRMSTLSTDEWRLVEATYTVDDDESTGDWIGIADDYYSSADIEEIRAAMFWGDFASSDLTDAGSFWVDNILLEVFANEADLLATPNPNPLPGGDPLAITGDMNGDGEVNFGDLSPFALGLTDIPGYEAMFPDVDRVAAGDVNMDDAFNFGDLTPFVDLLTEGGAASGSAVPEPSTVSLVLLATLFLAWQGRRRTL